jgi:hypothetical protein
MATSLPAKMFSLCCHRVRERLSYLPNDAVKKLIFTPAFFTSHPYPIHTSSSPRSALPSFASGSSKEGLMVCGGGEAWPWSSSPQRGGRVPVSPAEGRLSSPARPSLGSVSPQRPLPVATGSVSLEAREARPVAPSPSSSRRAQSPRAPPRARSQSPPRSHIGYLLRYPLPVSANRGPWTLQELIGPRRVR